MIQDNSNSSKEIYYRLIALWIVCEAFAGGIMHGIKLPFTGMIVSSLAIGCIILIAYHVPSRTAILKATVIVASFKLLLSPHAPPTAYIAVFFQGLLGQVLFLNRRFFSIKAICVAVLGLVESAIQRILVLVILYGNSFWKAVNVYIQKLTGENAAHNYSLYIALTYIFLHAIAGLVVGIYAAKLAKQSGGWANQYPGLLLPLDAALVANLTVKPKRKKIKGLFITAWILLLFMFLQAYFYPGNAVLPVGAVTRILLRSLLLVLTWYVLLSPLLMYVLKKWLSREQYSKQQQVAAILQLVPRTKQLFILSWQHTSELKGKARMQLFLKILLINILSEKTVPGQNTKFTT